MSPGRGQRFRPGRLTLGSFASSASPLLAEMMATAGAEFVLVDLQHGEATAADLQSILCVLEVHGTSSLVRVPWCEPSAIMRALDAGADGVIVPMVEDAEQAAVAAQATRDPPAGNRSFGPTRRPRPVPDSNESVVCFVMIETLSGLANVNAILDVEGVDGIFFGPVDFGLCLEIPVHETFRHPEVTKALEACVAAASACGKVVGTVSSGPDHTATLSELGVSFATVGSDKSFVAAGMAQALDVWRRGVSSKTAAT